MRLLPVDQISWIEADGMYVKLHTRDGSAHLHRALLGSLDGALDARRFIRIHRSAIVNIDVIAELRQDDHGDYVAVCGIRRRSAWAGASGCGCRLDLVSNCDSRQPAQALSSLTV